MDARILKQIIFNTVHMHLSPTFGRDGQYRTQSGRIDRAVPDDISITFITPSLAYLVSIMSHCQVFHVRISDRCALSFGSLRVDESIGMALWQPTFVQKEELEAAKVYESFVESFGAEDGVEVKQEVAAPRRRFGMSLLVDLLPAYWAQDGTHSQDIFSKSSKLQEP